MSLFWILLELKTITVVVTTGAVRRAKLQSNRHRQQTNTQLFTGRTDALPIAQRTVSKHRRENHRSLAGTKLYCSVTEARVGVNDLPRVAARKRVGRELKPRPVDRKFSAIITTPSGHSAYHTSKSSTQAVFRVHNPRPTTIY